MCWSSVVFCECAGLVFCWFLCVLPSVVFEVCWSSVALFKFVGVVLLFVKCVGRVLLFFKLLVECCFLFNFHV